MSNINIRELNADNQSFHEALLHELSRKANGSRSEVIDPELGVIEGDRDSEWDHSPNVYRDSSFESSFRAHGFFHPR